MNDRKIAVLCSLVLLLARPYSFAQPATTNGTQLFSAAITRLTRLMNPPTNEPPRTVTAGLRILKAEGLPQDLRGQRLELAFQPPDRLQLSASYQGQQFVICRDGEQLWIHELGKRFAVVGSPDKPLFTTTPERKDASPLGPLKLPFPPEQLQLLPLFAEVGVFPPEEIGGTRCNVLKAAPKPEAVSSFNLRRFTIQVWVRSSDSMPLRVEYQEPSGTDIEIEVENPQMGEPWPADKWRLDPEKTDHVETVARAHLTHFLSVALGMLDNRTPVLGLATGERRLLATEGKGRLEMIDGTRVLLLKGTPEEMGHQHGVLLKKDIRDLMDHILYGVGVGSSFEKGRWFFGEIEAAQQRLAKFMDKRYLREMDALADAAGVLREEVRLGNFFPELFHCSGFALFGKATQEGRMYHGRILDYMRGLGLEQHAVVMVLQPERGNAWVNVSYSGFIGSVTAMNDKHLAIGEMGGRGEGRWDGKPMAELVREVMERANTLNEALEIMRKGPRTCEYYYVISDAKSKRAVGIATAPDKFETIWPGQSHPLLPHGIQDTVLMSADDRYQELARRVQAGYGKFDAQAARELMKRPVCMTSNLHCALFEPDNLDFWVANADSNNVAADARFTHYNLAQLLQQDKNQ